MGEYSGVAAPVSTQYPQYIRDNYTVWATTMMWALESNEIWEAVDPGGDEFKKGASMYRKDRQALTAICSVMPMDVRQHLISKTSAKEAWETIKTLNLGHARVREAALQTLLKQYENLEMGGDEKLDAFASRVATLVNGIRALGEKLEEISIVRRFLRAAPPRYLPVVSAIEQCVDLKTLTMDDLIGRFKAHDERMKITYGDVVPEEHVMLTRAQWQAVVAKEKGDKAYDSRSDKRLLAQRKSTSQGRTRTTLRRGGSLTSRKRTRGATSSITGYGDCDGSRSTVCGSRGQACDEGVVGKQRSAPYPRETTDQASEALELVHGDICGPISPATPSGNEYFMLMVDDHSQYMWIVLLKSKDQAIQAFEKIKEAGEVKARAKKSLRIDRGGELKHKVVAMARSMMESKNLPGKFWGEAVNTAVYLLNRAPTRSMVGGTPYEAWYGRKPSVDHLRTFGCVAHIKTVSGHKRSLADRSTPMIMTGYEEGSKAYRLSNPLTNKVIVACDVVFEEDLSWIWNSTEPEEIFTVGHSDYRHTDDQVWPDTRIDAETGAMNSSSSALSTRSSVGAAARSLVSRARPGDEPSEPSGEVPGATPGGVSPRGSPRASSRSRAWADNLGSSAPGGSAVELHGSSVRATPTEASRPAGGAYGSQAGSPGGIEGSLPRAAPREELGPSRPEIPFRLDDALLPGLDRGRALGGGSAAGADGHGISPSRIDLGASEGTPAARSTAGKAGVLAKEVDKGHVFTSPGGDLWPEPGDSEGEEPNPSVLALASPPSASEERRPDEGRRVVVLSGPDEKMRLSQAASDGMEVDILLLLNVRRGGTYWLRACVSSELIVSVVGENSAAGLCLVSDRREYCWVWANTAAPALRILLEAGASTSSMPAGMMTLDGKRTTSAQHDHALQDDASKEEATETNAIARSSRGKNLGFHPESVRPSWQGR
ncbi:hypothetical protein QYE76_024813 [Lolium multiflorum]|uniref:Integrase catalytic domain-containing protein n=1 Tax=Lolium multiflorum TaxID=4521 RepID=A0AAD8VVD4_LOLMU|nr:hypothetical protein QYE76_024813 [Lolium multiflorum]